MNEKKVEKNKALRLRRKARTRKKISGTEERPRLSVFRSSTHVYAQVVDDVKRVTLVSASSFEKGAESKRASIEVCREVGKKLAVRCKEKNIGKIVFDRNGNIYHGRIKALAEGAREGGLEF
jgi:large subunit ribosomal protein L18